MKRNIFSIFNLPFAVLLCVFALSSCRPLGDDLVSYGQNDTHAYASASSSYAGQFDALWHALNANYAIWDYEAEKGLDWDKVYATYLPQFEALDDTTQKVKVTDARLKALYSQFLDSLHDGHLYLKIKNLQTGNSIDFNPQETRNYAEREEVMEAEKNITHLGHYVGISVEDRYRAHDYETASSRTIVIETVDSTCARLARAAVAYVKEVDDNGGPDEYNDSIYVAMKRLVLDATQIRLAIPKNDLDNRYLFKEFIELYNSLINVYQICARQLLVETPVIDNAIANDGVNSIHFALFEGNVAYLRFRSFALSPYLGADPPADTTTLYYTFYQAVNRVWDHWFDTIQTLHKNNELGGIIIDMRNNTGGYVSDYAYVMGALLPSGGYESHYMRCKQGTGRLDYAPIVPFVMPTYSKPHAVITEEPIVVLANSSSISMAEVTTWGVKSQSNGYFIGTRTWGGLSILSEDPADYSGTYSGCFGVADVTPFYGYVPSYISLFGDDMQVLEGVGITPDLDKPFDLNLWKTQERDNQLEAALDYISTK